MLQHWLGRIPRSSSPLCVEGCYGSSFGCRARGDPSRLWTWNFGFPNARPSGGWRESPLLLSHDSFFQQPASSRSGLDSGISGGPCWVLYCPRGGGHHTARAVRCHCTKSCSKEAREDGDGCSPGRTGCFPCFISAQLEGLRNNQDRLQEMVSSAGAQQRIPPHRQQFASPVPKLPFKKSKFLDQVGPPPRVRSPIDDLSHGLFQGGGGATGEDPILVLLAAPTFHPCTTISSICNFLSCAA